MGCGRVMVLKIVCERTCGGGDTNARHAVVVTAW